MNDPCPSGMLRACRISSAPIVAADQPSTTTRSRVERAGLRVSAAGSIDLRLGVGFRFGAARALLIAAANVPAPTSLDTRYCSHRMPMRDLTNPRSMYLKAGLFLLGGLLASAALIVERPELRTVVLLALAIWCFARCYYFAFYVIE